MKRLAAFVAAVTLAGTVALAHGGLEHIRGTVTKIENQTLTLQLSGNKTKTVTVTAKTAFKQAGKPAHLTDIKVGDRIIAEVAEGKSEAEEIEIGVAAPAPTTKKTQ